MVLCDLAESRHEILNSLIYFICECGGHAGGRKKKYTRGGGR